MSNMTRKKVGIYKKYYGEHYHREFLPCTWCGRLLLFGEATIEHLIPNAVKRDNKHINLDISCGQCNHKRGCLLQLVYTKKITQIQATTYFTSFITERKKNHLTIQDLNV